jgi:DNA gyrase subunit A
LPSICWPWWTTSPSLRYSLFATSLDAYLSFQEEIIVRRTRYDLRKAEERAHLLEGLIIAQDNIDEVVHIIRNSYDNAKQNLMERFGLDDVQAQAICDMRLIALQGLNREKLEAEYKDLEDKDRLLQGPSFRPDEKIKAVLKTELTEPSGTSTATSARPRSRTCEDDIDDRGPHRGGGLRLHPHPQRLHQAPAHHGIQRPAPGRQGRQSHDHPREEDYVETVFTASTHDYILFFTNTGKVYVRKGYKIPRAERSARGSNIVNILPLDPGERIATMLHGRGIDEESFIVMMTRAGTIKRMCQSELKNIRSTGIRAITLDDGDELISVRQTDGTENIFIATHDGMSICFSEEDVRPMGRNAVGVRGIRLRSGDYVVGAGSSGAGAAVLSVTENGYGKRTLTGEYTVQHRGGMGLKNYNVTDKTGFVVDMKLVNDEDDLLVVSDDGTIIRMAVGDISVLGRSTQGVRVMNVNGGAKVISIARTDKEESGEDEGPDEAAPEEDEVLTPDPDE